MRRLTPALALLVLPALSLPVRADLLKLLGFKRDLEVITVTDVSTTGALVPRASPDEPQYYLASSLGYRDLGGYLAGDEEPPEPDVIRLISSELAKQGYLPATTRSAPPSLILVYAWGTLNAKMFYGQDPSQASQVNREQIVRFLGGGKVGLREDYFNPLTAPLPGLSPQSYAARNLLDVARENFYVMVVSAYDLDAALQQKHYPPLWTTRIAAPALGFELGNVLPAMLAIGGQQFGRDTASPVWVNASDKFKPNVTLGELQLLEYLQGEPLPVPVASDAAIDKK